MSLLANYILKKMVKPLTSISARVEEKTQESPNMELLEVSECQNRDNFVQYTEEELAAIVLKELGVSDVIISNPTIIYQLKRVIKGRFMDRIPFDETKIDSFGNTSPAQTLSDEVLDEIIDLMRHSFKVLANGGVELEVYEYQNDSTYQVERSNGRIDTQQGIIVHNFVYEPNGDDVIVSEKSSELRTTKVAKRFEEEAEERGMTEYTRQKINRWYDPAILKTVKRIYNADGIEMACEIVEGQTLYYYPDQVIAERHETIDSMHFGLIKQNRTKIERRTDNLGIVFVTFNDDIPQRNGYPTNKIFNLNCGFNICLPLSSLPYINIDDELEVAREKLRNNENPMTEGIQAARVYDAGDEETKRTIENEILDGIESTECLGEQSEKIRDSLRKTAQVQFCNNAKPYFKELTKGA